MCVCQRCDIGDASRGSLSSYAYILMVLYFLQQRQPPVIPVLQEVTLVPLTWVGLLLNVQKSIITALFL